MAEMTRTGFGTVTAMVDRLVREFSFLGRSFKVSCIDPTPQHASWFTFEDESEVRNRHWKICEGDRILDVGAAYGSYTMCALAMGAGRVWAWSPQDTPEGIAEKTFFEESLELNGWSHLCKVFKTGIYDKTGWLDAMDQSFTEHERSGSDIIRVETLDDWAAREIPDEERIDWLKIDVEGAEVEVVNGGRELIRKFRPRVFVENHEFKAPGIESRVRDALQALAPYRHVMTEPHHGVSHSTYVCD